MLNSLFFRMRFIHYVGIILLIINGTFFTDNLLGQIIQYVVAVVILFHDLDEKANGVDMTKSLIAQLNELEKGNKIVLKSNLNSELTEAAISVNRFQEIFLKAQNSDEKAHQIENIISQINNDYSRVNSNMQTEKDVIESVVSNGESIKNNLHSDISNATLSKETIQIVDKKIEIVKSEIFDYSTR